MTLELGDPSERPALDPDTAEFLATSLFIYCVDNLIIPSDKQNLHIETLLKERMCSSGHMAFEEGLYLHAGESRVSGHHQRCFVSALVNRYPDGFKTIPELESFLEIQTGINLPDGNFGIYGPGASICEISYFLMVRQMLISREAYGQPVPVDWREWEKELPLPSGEDAG